VPRGAEGTGRVRVWSDGRACHDQAGRMPGQHARRKAGVDWYVRRAGRVVVRSNGQLCRQVCKEGVWLLRAGVADKYERRPPPINCA